MTILHTTQQVTGPSLTIAVPAEFDGMQVEVIVYPLAAGPLPQPSLLYAPYAMPKPALTPEDEQFFAANPYPLRGTGSEYIDPFESVVPAEDWSVYGEEGKGDAQ